MCVTHCISYLANKLFHNQFYFMLGKQENRFPLLAGCKIAPFLHHLLTKMLLYLIFCSLVDPVLAHEPGYNWQLEFRMKSWMLPLSTCTCVCSASKQTWTESRMWLQRYHLLLPASQASLPASTNQHQPCCLFLKDSICPRALWDKFVTQEVVYSLVSGVAPKMGSYLLL